MGDLCWQYLYWLQDNFGLMPYYLWLTITYWISQFALGILIPLVLIFEAEYPISVGLVWSAIVIFLGLRKYLLILVKNCVPSYISADCPAMVESIFWYLYINNFCTYIYAVLFCEVYFVNFYKIGWNQYRYFYSLDSFLGNCQVIHVRTSKCHGT